MRARRTALALVLACGCVRASGPLQLGSPAPVTGASIEPVVVERSAPIAPGWTERIEQGGGESVDFVGFGAGPSFEVAARAAERDS